MLVMTPSEAGTVYVYQTGIHATKEMPSVTRK